MSVIRSRRRGILALAAVLCLAAAPVASAGQSVKHFSGQRTHAGFHKSHGGPSFKFRNAGRSAKILHGQVHRSGSVGHFASASFGRGKSGYRKFGHGKFGHGDFDRGGFNGSQIAIVIGATGGAEQAGAAPGAVILESGTCAPGEYCTLRLGAGSSAPKIITLNSGRATVTCDGQACSPIN